MAKKKANPTNAQQPEESLPQITVLSHCEGDWYCNTTKVNVQKNLHSFDQYEFGPPRGTPKHPQQTLSGRGFIGLYCKPKGKKASP